MKKFLFLLLIPFLSFGQFNPIFFYPSVSVSDPDARAFILAAGISSVAQKNLINSLVIDLKANGLWTQMQAIYPMVGGTSSSTKYNLKDARDLDAAYRIAWNGSIAFSNDGVTSGGGYGNTFLSPSAIQNVNSNGVTLAVGTSGVSADTFEMGALNSGTQRTLIQVHATGVSGANFRINGASMIYAQSSAVALGLYTGQRVSSTVSNIWKNSTKVHTSNSGGTLPSANMYICAYNNSGVATNPSTRRVQSVYIHQGLSDSDVSVLHTIINTFENGLGRKTW